MDKIKFAVLISWLSKTTGYEFGGREVEQIDDFINQGMPETNPEPAHLNLDRLNDLGCLLSAIKHDKKIEAIKHFRSLSGFGLKEAKDCIELHWPYPPAHMRSPVAPVADAE